MNNPPDCHLCPLRDGAKQVVWGHGNESAELMFVAEAPGKNENAQGRPMVGQSGEELDKYCRDVGIDRYSCFVDNVIRCKPPNDRDPKPSEIEACRVHLLRALETVQPKVIVALGAVATHWFLGGVNLEQVHGIPYKYESSLWLEGPVVVVPMYHPAYALRETAMMAIIQDDFKQLAKIMRGEVAIGGVKDAYPTPYYSLTPPTVAWVGPPPSGLVAVDTESAGLNGEPWCMSFSTTPGVAYVIKANNKRALAAFAHLVDDPRVTTILHNALYDLPVLAKLGIIPFKVVDTMVGAYNLQRLPQGLKALAYRLCGMEMGSYEEAVAPATRKKALAYLEEVQSHPWPMPEPILTWDKGKPHVKQPQPIEKKAARILKDADEKGADPWERWHTIDLDEGRGMVEDTIGPMVPGYLADIPEERAVHYAARDADATLRIWPILSAMLKDAGLSDVFATDGATIPMVSDMMVKGMRVDKPQLATFSKELETGMEGLAREISSHIHGEYINPDSPKQVSELLFGELKLKPGKKTKGGAYYSTDDDIIKGLKDAHPVVAPILRYRELSKVKGTYTDPLQAWADSESRVHTTIKMTRTETGRYSSADPNLQNIPIRTELGRLVRRAFLASPGCVLMSQDYSQVEFRVEAHVSQDSNLMRVFTEGRDLHLATAMNIFGLPEHEIDDMKHRRPAKTAGFGTLFDISAPALLVQLESMGCTGWDEVRCRQLIDDWFKLYPGVKEHMRAVYREARRYGNVRDMFNRMRLVPEVKSTHSRIIRAGERQAGNMPAQGGAQGIIKKAMADLTPLYRTLQEEGDICDPLIQIHDDLVWDVGEGILDTVVPLFTATMESAVRLTVPVKVETKVGGNWAELHKYVRGEP